MKAVSIFAFSLAAALIGALAWVLVVYYGKVELGLIAWGIGLLAGYGARFGAKETVGVVPGALATIAAIIGVAVGKLALIAIVLASVIPAAKTDEQATEWVAFSIAQERGARGETIEWPASVDFDKELTRPDFPAELWTEAEARWNGFTDRQKSRYRAHPPMMNRAWATSLVAQEVVAEWQSAGKAIAWPTGAGPSGDPTDPTTYPPDVWAEADRRFSALDAPAAEIYEDQITEAVDAAQSSAMGAAFMASLSAWDVLWAGLAAWTAFRIGKGTRIYPALHQDPSTDA